MDRTESHNKPVITLVKSGSTGEYLVLGFNGSSALVFPSVMPAYCPPTHVIIYRNATIFCMYFTFADFVSKLTASQIKGLDSALWEWVWLTNVDIEPVNIS